MDDECSGSLTLWADNAGLTMREGGLSAHPVLSGPEREDDQGGVTLRSPASHPIDLDGSCVDDGQVSPGEGWETDEDGVTLWDPQCQCHPVVFGAEWERDGLAVTLWD
jgi:hypothetical protein